MKHCNKFDNTLARMIDQWLHRLVLLTPKTNYTPLFYYLKLPISLCMITHNATANLQNKK